jgi:hypothetical protein
LEFIPEASNLTLLQLFLFLGAEGSAGDLTVAFFNQDRFHMTSWNDFKAIEERGMAAVVRAGWMPSKLEGISQSVRQGTFNQINLEKVQKASTVEFEIRLPSSPPFWPVTN